VKTFRPLLFALAILCLPTGCALSRSVVKAPAATTRAGDATVTQSGYASTPATAASDTQSATVPIPAGSHVVFNEKLGTLGVTLSTDSTLTLTTRRDTVTGPQAFTPPAPPTPADEAKGKAALWLRLGMVGGIAAVIFGFWKGWDLIGIGGGAIAAACFIGLSLEGIPLWLWIVFGIGAALAVTGPALWHLKLKKLAPAT
jgi:hypothetical protein